MASEHPPSYSQITILSRHEHFIVQQTGLTARPDANVLFSSRVCRQRYIIPPHSLYFYFSTEKQEPSSNVAPRTSGRKIEGSLIATAATDRRAYLTCDATAFPVPVYRYLPGENSLGREKIFRKTFPTT